MIRVECRCYYDTYKNCIWPKFVVALPRKGDFIQGKTGSPLMISRVIHCQGREMENLFLILELTTENGKVPIG